MSESTVQKQTDLQGLSTAILLPSVSLFGEPVGLYADEVGPLTSVVGIGLFQRTVLTLQRAGIRQLHGIGRAGGGSTQTGVGQRVTCYDPRALVADS